MMLVQTYLFSALKGCPDTDKDGEGQMINVLLLQDQKKMQVVLFLILETEF
jgi:hypothetical protein